MIVNNSGAVGQSGSGQRGPNETRNRPDEYTVPLSHYPSSCRPTVPLNARGESRTRTGSLPPDFESGASAIPPLGQAGKKLVGMVRKNKDRRETTRFRWRFQPCFWPGAPPH
jgi:hypothetical protein